MNCRPSPPPAAAACTLHHATHAEVVARVELCWLGWVDLLGSQREGDYAVFVVFDAEVALVVVRGVVVVTVNRKRKICRTYCQTAQVVPLAFSAP
jgi:hypothetical protein